MMYHTLLSSIVPLATKIHSFMAVYLPCFINIVHDRMPLCFKEHFYKKDYSSFFYMHSILFSTTTNQESVDILLILLTIILIKSDYFFLLHYWKHVVFLFWIVTNNICNILFFHPFICRTLELYCCTQHLTFIVCV